MLARRRCCCETLVDNKFLVFGCNTTLDGTAEQLKDVVATAYRDAGLTDAAWSATSARGYDTPIVKPLVAGRTYWIKLVHPSSRYAPTVVEVVGKASVYDSAHTMTVQPADGYACARFRVCGCDDADQSYAIPLPKTLSYSDSLGLSLTLNWIGGWVWRGVGDVALPGYNCDYGSCPAVTVPATVSFQGMSSFGGCAIGLLWSYPAKGILGCPGTPGTRGAGGSASPTSLTCPPGFEIAFSGRLQRICLDVYQDWLPFTATITE